LTVTVRDADWWLVSNLPALHATAYRIFVHPGLPFHDVPSRPDPEFQRPLIGVRALRAAGLRAEIDFANGWISVWTPDAPTS
jgi:hypothetical protein